MEVLAGLEAGELLQDRLHDLARRSRVGGRLEDDELAGAEPLGDARDGGGDDREVGLALLRQRRRERDQDRVRARELVVVGRGADGSALDERRELFRRNVLDVALAAVDPLDDAPLDVDQHDVVAAVREYLGKWQADVACPDDRNAAHDAARLARRAAATFSEACPSP